MLWDDTPKPLRACRQECTSRSSSVARPAPLHHQRYTILLYMKKSIALCGPRHRSSLPHRLHVSSVHKTCPTSPFDGSSRNLPRGSTLSFPERPSSMVDTSGILSILPVGYNLG